MSIVLETKIVKTSDLFSLDDKNLPEIMTDGVEMKTNKLNSLGARVHYTHCI